MTDGFISANFRLPPDHPPTENELAWVCFLRLLTDDRVPHLTLRHVQELRRMLTRGDGAS
jgi:hypothetical protein